MSSSATRSLRMFEHSLRYSWRSRLTSIALVALAWVQSAACFHDPFVQKSSVRRSQHRITVNGIILQDCLAAVPAKNEVVELVMKKRDLVIASSQTNDNGEFGLRAPYIDMDELALYVRIGGIELPLPREDLNRSYRGAVLLVPCRTGGSVGRWRNDARTSTPTAPFTQH